ncbi:MAG TPA: DUF1634 domain-containing protein [Thermomicrobiales bacterium]|nr:DUF1634 domain-containing protein [Thermomicrobiales bacterium]
MADQATPRARDTAATAGHEPGGHPMELWISYVLRTGVLTAGAIILVGLAWFLVGGAHGAGPASLDALIGGGGHTLAVSPATIARDIAAGDPIAVIQLGVLALILTPLIRVGMTAVLFLLERDRVFTIVTAIVFAILIIGLVGVGS